MKRASLPVAVAVLALFGCTKEANESSRPSQSDLPAVTHRSSGADLAAARRGFTTQLTSRGPAPQNYREATPPAGVKEVFYESSELTLKAWLSDDPGDGKKRPVVVYLHGGFAFAPVDWEDASPFVDAGFVLMMPMLRGENGNSGAYECYYGEVDDAIAAGRFVSELPYVDKENVFVAGHSAGAELAVLVAMMPSDYRAAAALSGYLDSAEWVETAHPSLVVFDTSNPEEIRLRNPMAFPESLRIPLILYAEPGEMRAINAAFLALAQRAGKSCELFVTEGDHRSMVEPAVQHTIGWYRKQMK